MLLTVVAQILPNGFQESSNVNWARLSTKSESEVNDGQDTPINFGSERLHRLTTIGQISSKLKTPLKRCPSPTKPIPPPFQYCLQARASHQLHQCHSAAPPETSNPCNHSKSNQSRKDTKWTRCLSYLPRIHLKKREMLQTLRLYTLNVYIPRGYTHFINSIFSLTLPFYHAMSRSMLFWTFTKKLSSDFPSFHDYRFSIKSNYNPSSTT